MMIKTMFLVGATLAGLALDGCSSSRQGNPQSRETTTVAAQDSYATPEAAVDALAAAVDCRDREQLGKVLGPRLNELSTGDPDQDDADLQRLGAALQRGYRLEDDGVSGMKLLIGHDDWLFPAPLVRQGQQWKFDTDAGLEEVMNRRVGKNELDAIATCRYYVAAQKLYYQMAPDGDEVHSYAMRVASTPGKRDGLFWQAKENELQSPLGPLVTEAVSQGQLKEPASRGKRQPYRGYFYKILTRQGPDAKGGEKNYVDADGRMTGGFALVAWPAQYGHSGVMSFMVNQDEVVYLADLGEGTQQVAEAMTAFNPDKAWSPVEQPASQPPEGRE